MKTFFELREAINIDELSSKTLTSYMTKASSQAGKTNTPANTQDKRIAGVNKAMKKAYAEGYRVHATSKDGEKMKSGVHSTAKAAHDMHYKMAKSGMYKKIEVVKENTDLDEAAPKIKPDFVKVQRAKDAAHNDAMGRTATGRKKPVRTMTSTQRSMASMNKEEVDLDEGISNLSHSRLKYHATKGVSHGSHSNAEIKDEHKRRLRSEPDYVKAKASMNEGIKAKPDATEVIRKKKQMAAISTSDKDKLSKIAQMMARANEGLEQDGPRKPGGDGLSKNFGKQYGKKADAYLDKKAKERRDQAAKNDPGASKKNLGPAVIDTDKADKKAKAKGTSMAARFQNKMAAKK